jgi:short-subunit dehydrogenase
VAICARSEEQLSTAKLKLREDGIVVVTTKCDVSDPGQVAELIVKVKAQMGPIDILVNNAGEILVAPLENTTVADLERSMAVMFWGVVHPTLAVLPQMRAHGGRIATITSIGGKVSVPHLLSYSCAKAAAIAFCEGLRAELGNTNVRITTVVPGLMRTGSHVNARFKGDQQKEGAWFSVAASTPILTMKAERAAAKIVHAIRGGSSEIILSPQANVLARLQGMAPGLVPDILSLVNRLLPKGTHDNTAITGADLSSEQSALLKTLTTFGRGAGERLNQVTT